MTYFWPFGAILDTFKLLWIFSDNTWFFASKQLHICLRIMHVRRIPKISIFMAVKTKIVTEKAKKWPEMARFWPKSRYNGRVMAREVFFYQCLWVTKFCAKFGCSRTPRTASVPNSFIVLRCMWKEPAPFKVKGLMMVMRMTMVMTMLHAWLVRWLPPRRSWPHWPEPLFPHFDFSAWQQSPI